MEDTCVVPGQGLEGGGEQFVLTSVIQPCQLCACLYMFHFIESTFEFFALAHSRHFKTMNDVVYFH